MTLKKYIYELLNLIIFLIFACIGILIITLISAGICFLMYHKINWFALPIIWHIIVLLLSPLLMPITDWVRKFTQEKLAFLKD